MLPFLPVSPALVLAAAANVSQSLSLVSQVLTNQSDQADMLVLLHPPQKQILEQISNKISEKNGGLDILACNTSIMAMNDDRTVDGFNVEIQACHLSHAMLTKQCMSSLQQAAKTRDEARVVFQSLMARYGDDLE